MKMVIKVDLDRGDCYVNLFDGERISEELHNYFWDYSLKGNKEVEILVKVHYLVMRREKKRIREMLYRDFSETLDDISGKMKRLGWQNVILLGLGFVGYFIFKFFEGREMQFFSEFFLIIMWGVFWEVASNILFVWGKWYRYKKKYERFVKAKIRVEN